MSELIGNPRAGFGKDVDRREAGPGKARECPVDGRDRPRRREQPKGPADPGWDRRPRFAHRARLAPAPGNPTRRRASGPHDLEMPDHVFPGSYGLLALAPG